MVNNSTNTNKTAITTQKQQSPLTTQKQQSPLTTQKQQSPLTTQKQQSLLTTQKDHDMWRSKSKSWHILTIKSVNGILTLSNDSTDINKR